MKAGRRDWPPQPLWSRCHAGRPHSSPFVSLGVHSSGTFVPKGFSPSHCPTQNIMATTGQGKPVNLLLHRSAVEDTMYRQ